MWWPVSAAANAEAEIAAAGIPRCVCSKSNRLATAEPNLVNGQGLPASPFRTCELKRWSGEHDSD